MFAVPGWNLSAKSLVQEQVKPVKNSSKSASPAIPTAGRRESQSTKKRKHQQDQPEAVYEKQDSLSKISKNSKIRAQPDSRSHGSESNESTDRSSEAGLQPSVGQKALSTRSATTGGPVKPTPTGTNDAEPSNSSTPTSVVKQRLKQSTKSVTRPQPSGDAVKNKADLQPLPPIPPTTQNLTPLQAKMRAKLTSARFRHLNETLYTSSSIDAKTLFANSPDLFSEYHAGFAQQVKDSWPRNPVETYVKHIKFRGGITSPVNNIAPLPRRRPGTCKIADLGCGDAPLARGLQNVAKKLNLKIDSFDLHAPNSHVTVADISALPLHDGEADMAIFCLSLMGTNWLTFVEEAWRVLRGDGKGEVWVAEVKSRFGRLSARKAAGKVVENSVGKRRKGPANVQEDNDAVENRGLAETEQAGETRPEDDTDLQPFIDSFQRRGFMLKEDSVDKTNKMFVTMIFNKTGVPRAGKWKGMKWDGKEYRQIEDPRFTHHKKFQPMQRSAPEEEIDEKEEGKLLKPCVYKQR